MTRRTPVQRQGNIMRKLTYAAGVLAAGAVLAATPGATAISGQPSAALTGSALYHCPYGAVCIYPQNVDPRGGAHYPESNGIFYSYGYHNLSNQYGWHYIVDNQYGGAWDYECSGYNGTGTVLEIGAEQSWGRLWMDPINSIVLTSAFRGGYGSPCPKG
jgi:hypothetical protein